MPIAIFSTKNSNFQKRVYSFGVCEEMSIYASYKNPFIRGPKWWHVDATGHRVGRLSTQVAALLFGKYKPTRIPSADCGDYVVLVNAAKIDFSGKKWKQKYYYWHTGYPGGLKQRQAKTMLEKNPTFIIRQAIKNMLPKNKLQRNYMNRLLVYPDEKHPHSDQDLEDYWSFPSIHSVYYPDYDPEYDGRLLFTLEPTQSSSENHENEHFIQLTHSLPKLDKKTFQKAKRDGRYGHGRSKQLDHSPHPDMQLLGHPITPHQLKYARQLIADENNAKYWPIPDGSSQELYESTMAQLERIKYLKENPEPAPIPPSTAHITFDEAKQILGKYPPMSTQKK